MKKITEKINKRFYEFSVVINPQGAEAIDWVQLNEVGGNIVDTLETLKFPTPLELSNILESFSGDVYTSTTEKNARKFKITEFVGQLEMGSLQKKPHYNLAFKTDIKILPSVLVRELSQTIFNTKNSKAINVEPAHCYNNLIDYCTKSETRLELDGTKYYPPYIDYRVSLFNQALLENPSLKKSVNIHVYFNS